MDNTRLGKTTFEYIPQELLHPRRKTNRLWTLFIIIVIGIAFGAFWYYKQAAIMNAPLSIISVITPRPASMNDLQDSLSNTAIPDFHELL